jgi:TolB protein
MIHFGKIFVFLLIMISTFPGILVAQTDVFLKIQSGETRRINIAVEKFSTNQNPELANDLRQIIIDDLNNSGFLSVVEPATSDSASQVAEVIVTGEVAHRSNRFRFEFNLLESISNRKLLTKSYKAYPFAIRALAHTAADEIVYQLCGDYGVACTKIAFVTEQKGGKELAIMDYDGQRLKILTRNKSLNLMPCWSDDGQFLLFATYAWGGGPLPGKYTLEGGNIIRFADYPGTFTAPAYSPDGKQVAFVLTRNGNSDIYIADREGKNLQRLTNNPGIDTGPCWAPNGREIVFSSDRSGSPQIYIMDAEGGNVRRLTYEFDYNASAKWSPKGDYIVFVTFKSNRFQLCLIDITGENLTCLTNDLASYESPAWSPDGNHLVFTSNRTGKWDLYSMLRDGSLLRRLTFSGGNTGPSWSPRLKPFN